MKKLAHILILFSISNLTAQNNLSVKEFMKYYVKVFNEENLIEYIKCLHLPRSIISNGKIIYKTEESTFEMIFGNVKKAGWATMFQIYYKWKYYFVDNKENIYKLCKPIDKGYFLSRPRRFGKSLTKDNIHVLFSRN